MNLALSKKGSEGSIVATNLVLDALGFYFEPHLFLQHGHVTRGACLERKLRKELMAEIEPEYASEAAPERKHHKQAEIAYNRPDYREAKWEKAVKVHRFHKQQFQEI